VDEPIAFVTCRTCQAEVWRGGQMSADGTAVVGMPVADGQELLTAFADTSCPRGGVGCPNTTAGRQTARDDQPATARELRKVSELLAVVDARTRRP